MNPKKLLNVIAVFAVCMFTAVTLTTAQADRTSGVYLTAADYEKKQLAFAGDCGSKNHKLKPHDFPNKPYIDVKHESEKYRYAKSDLFGFRECDERDYRFGSNLNYQILEAEEWNHAHACEDNHHKSMQYQQQFSALTSKWRHPDPLASRR